MTHTLYVCAFTFSVCVSMWTAAQCDYVLGEYEDDIIDLYGGDMRQTEIERVLCYDITGDQYRSHYLVCL